MDEKKIRLLADAAEAARQNAYCRYSGFSVGAALLAQSGRVYTGCNIENASFPAGQCAEQSAVSAAVSAGERSFTAIAVAGGKEGGPAGYCPPCGICRQVLREFCKEDFTVILLSGDGFVLRTLGQLLPDSFSKTNM